jgi:hypothetical protein
MGGETVAMCGRFAAHRAAFRVTDKQLKYNRKIACIGREFGWQCRGESVKKTAP